MNKLLWFRSDLRLVDNPALHYFLAHPHRERPAIALFFITPKQWQQHDWSAIKIDFILRHVQLLKVQLTTLNIDLKIVEVDDFDAQRAYLHDYCQREQINEVVANSELEINERSRDRHLLNDGIPLTLFEADVIVPKGKIITQAGEMFKVFTPFKRAWLTYVKQCGVPYLGRPIDREIVSDAASKLKESHVCLSAKWPLVTTVEDQLLPKFYQEKLSVYSQQRDFPALKGTSGISPYLAAGVLSPRYVFTTLLARYPDILNATDSPEFSWLNELIWRDFYRHLLFHHPRLCKHQNFNVQYNQLQWPNRPDSFQAWCEGKTGYPLVDAAMRQLNQTGWMHNRLRMVVASFLTKHLLVDWRKGEQYFMQHLIDGDLAANNGGWQWAASTGCDAQPYFRVFNPILQSERFDPNGDFIRKYLPELQNVPTKQIHFPHQYISKHKLNIYWPPIVEHKTARANALSFYKMK